MIIVAVVLVDTNFSQEWNNKLGQIMKFIWVNLGGQQVTSFDKVASSNWQLNSEHIVNLFNSLIDS